MYLEKSYIYSMVSPRAGDMRESKADECGFPFARSTPFSCFTDVFFFNIHAFQVCDL